MDLHVIRAILRLTGSLVQDVWYCTSKEQKSFLGLASFCVKLTTAYC